MFSTVQKLKQPIERTLSAVLMLLLLTCALTACNKPLEPITLLRITSTPEGAEVMINGDPYGVSPVTITDLLPGEHYAILVLADHERLTKRFLLPEEEPIQLDLKMERETGQLSVTTKPIEAKVYLTDTLIEDAEPKLIGETPLEDAEIPSGTYFLEIKKDNHEDKSTELLVERRGMYLLDYSLKAIGAYLHIYSRPDEAQIWVNDELYPVETPAKLALPPGEYAIGVHKTGYNMSEGIVTLLPNGQHKFDAVLEKGDRPIGMVLIPEGEFIMGDDNKSPDERPMKKEYLKAFYMDKYEVTNAEFKTVFPKHTFVKNREKFPATGISWGQASDYALAVGKRLPSEAEWEKAARGMKGKEFPWGAIFDAEKANTEENRTSSTLKIGSFKGGVSEFGCFDMSGNVYEWTSTWYNPYEGNPEVSVEYGRVYRVLRGGSFMTDSFESRGARRHYAKPGAAREDFGFRCAKDLTK